MIREQQNPCKNFQLRLQDMGHDKGHDEGHDTTVKHLNNFRAIKIVYVQHHITVCIMEK